MSSAGLAGRESPERCFGNVPKTRRSGVRRRARRRRRVRQTSGFADARVRRGGHVARAGPAARDGVRVPSGAVRGSVRRVQEGGADGLWELHGAREERRRVRGRRVFRV